MNPKPSTRKQAVAAEWGALGRKKEQRVRLKQWARALLPPEANPEPETLNPAPETRN